MDVISKIEDRRPSRELSQIPPGGKHVYLIDVDILPEFVDEVDHADLGVLHDVADTRQPAVELLVFLATLVLPVGSHPLFGQLIHAAGPDLHLDPFLVRTHDSGMQRLIAIRLGDGDPVAHPLRIGLVLIGHHRIDRPAIGLFILRCRVKDHPDGKKIVYLIKSDLLLLHLVVYGENRLGPGLHLEPESPGLQFFLDGLHKLGGKPRTLTFGFTEAVDHLGVSLRTEILQTEVQQLRIEFVESKPVCKRRIDVVGLGGNPRDRRGRIAVEIAHDLQPVGNLHQNDPHVARQSQHQHPEILGMKLDGIGAQGIDLGHPLQHDGDRLSEETPDLLRIGFSFQPVVHHIVQQPRQYRIDPQANLFHNDGRHLQGVHQDHLPRIKTALTQNLPGKNEGLGKLCSSLLPEKRRTSGLQLLIAPEGLSQSFHLFRKKRPPTRAAFANIPSFKIYSPAAAVSSTKTR